MQHAVQLVTGIFLFGAFVFIGTFLGASLKDALGDMPLRDRTISGE